MHNRYWSESSIVGEWLMSTAGSEKTIYWVGYFIYLINYFGFDPKRIPSTYCKHMVIFQFLIHCQIVSAHQILKKNLLMISMSQGKIISKHFPGMIDAHGWKKRSYSHDFVEKQVWHACRLHVIRIACRLTIPIRPDIISQWNSLSTNVILSNEACPAFDRKSVSRNSLPFVLPVVSYIVDRKRNMIYLVDDILK